MSLLYIDPGTGMILLQLVLAVFASVGIFFGKIRKKIASFFKKNK